MKRSDMIKHLATIIWESQGEFGEPSERQAKYVLDKIEQLGTAPPETWVLVPIESDGRQYPLVPGDFKLDNGLWYTPQQRVWDKEDET